MNPTAQLMWNICTELRKELVEAQKVRAQIIGLKVTFVSAGMGVIWANFDKVPHFLMVVPALASVFFDCLISSYSFSIRRIGYYCRCHLEPVMRASPEWPPGVPAWEEFMCTRMARLELSLIGHLGLTAVAMGAAVLALLEPFHTWTAVTLLVLLGFLGWVDYQLYTQPLRRFGCPPTPAGAPEAAPGTSA
jgi:hypothetical protein